MSLAFTLPTFQLRIGRLGKAGKVSQLLFWTSSLPGLDTCTALSLSGRFQLASIHLRVLFVPGANKYLGLVYSVRTGRGRTSAASIYAAARQSLGLVPSLLHAHAISINTSNMHAYPFLHDTKTLHPRLKLSLRHCPKKNPGYIIYGCMDRPFVRSNFNVTFSRAEARRPPPQLTVAAVVHRPPHGPSVRPPPFPPALFPVRSWTRFPIRTRPLFGTGSLPPSTSFSHHKRASCKISGHWQHKDSASLAPFRFTKSEEHTACPS